MSNKEIECSTTQEAEKAIDDGNVPVLIADIYLSVSINCKIVCKSPKPHVESRGNSSPHVESWENSSPHVVSRGNSSPHVESRGNSSPHVESWENSSPHVVSWENSSPHVVSRGNSSPHVESRGNSSPHVESWENSSPHVVSWGNSSPHVVSRGNSSPHVESRGNSSPHVEAFGNCQLKIKGKVKVKATVMVMILAIGLLPEIVCDNGVCFINRVIIDTPQKWCEQYGVEICGNCAVLFKALDENFEARNNFRYTPGTTQKDPNWDPDPARECGGGLHFSPSPRHAKFFNPTAKKFVGVLVPLETLLIHPDGQYPDKSRGPETLGCWEVDINGKPV